MTEGRERTRFCFMCRRKLVEKETHDRWVYFVWSSEAQAIKIGVTDNVKRRLSQLKNASPFPLTVLKTVRGSEIHERFLHKKFKELRTQREWFKSTHELLEFVEGLVEGEPLLLDSLI